MDSPEEDNLHEVSTELDDLIREIIAKDIAERDLSIPAYLQDLGFTKDSQDFGNYRRALDRFLSAKNGVDGPRSANLPHIVYDRACHKYRNMLPDYDRLNPALFRPYDGICMNAHRSLAAFHRAKTDRVREITERATGRFLIYKRPVNHDFRNMVLRSYARIGRPPIHTSTYVMITEYQNGSLTNPDIGIETIDDYFLGIVTRKDGVLTFIMRHLYNGAIKHIYLDNVAVDFGMNLITGGYGHVMETCDAFTKNCLASSGCVFKRIPDHFTYRDINKLTNITSRDEVNPDIANHLFPDD